MTPQKFTIIACEYVISFSRFLPGSRIRYAKEQFCSYKKSERACRHSISGSQLLLVTPPMTSHKCVSVTELISRNAVQSYLTEGSTVENAQREKGRAVTAHSLPGRIPESPRLQCYLG